LSGGLVNPKSDYQFLPFFLYQRNYFAGMIKDLSPAGSNSLSAPRPNSYLGLVKSNGKRSSAKQTLISGLAVYASPREECAAIATPA
jgi:hypothetical protein